MRDLLLSLQFGMAARQPTSHAVVANVREVTDEEVREELEALRAEDPDTHARLTEIVVIDDPRHDPLPEGGE